MTFAEHDPPPAPSLLQPYWQQWLAPPTVITLCVAAVTVYGSQVIQAERLDAMRAKLEAVERDYQRRDVLAEQLRSIDGRLLAIEVKIGVAAEKFERR